MTKRKDSEEEVAEEVMEEVVVEEVVEEVPEPIRDLPERGRVETPETENPEVVRARKQAHQAKLRGGK